MAVAKLSAEEKSAAPEPLVPANDGEPAVGVENLLAYSLDVGRRAVLFLDTLRQRAENIVAHERAGKPPLLDFDFEVIAEARHFERPTNYSLLRITRVGEDCLEDCVQPGLRPVVVFDPRAGHGPGIGGFKRESEVGLALRAGHPTYFVAFAPEPVAGQTLHDVLRTLRRFVEEVGRRHPGQPPVLYGNCQAGWAITILAAGCQGLVGTAVLNGSPLSYWAGEPGVNPMRTGAGFTGGIWTAHLLSDLGDGRFDGAWLVQNFEALKPEGVWAKYAGLFEKGRTERERFLEFERWWNGFYMLGRDEILAITENLFVGNRLEQGLVRLCKHCNVDLRRIRNPLVIFASYGDNITPPAQALGWIPVVYPTTEALKEASQRIVYLTNPHVGHLGMFVSAKVADREHRAILASVEQVELLAPGLYEMKLAPAGKVGSAPRVTFEERRVEDVAQSYPRASFERVRDLSEAAEAFYATFVSPWIRAAATPFSARLMEDLHPMRTSRLAFAEEYNPWMRLVRRWAEAVPPSGDLPEDNPFRAAEHAWLAGVGAAIDAGGRIRDAWAERIFDAAYGGLSVPVDLATVRSPTTPADTAASA
ncbi:DUF3141 domain-containing protein [Alsobacter sp. SYSU BS001988]